jgi:FKBP-type peptidyl-prolyl cis-trans isomerase FkpA
MTRLTKFFLPFFIIICLFGCGDKQKTESATKSVDLTSEDNKASYAIGISIGNFAKQALTKREELGMKMDDILVVEGFKDALADSLKEKVEILNDVLKKYDDKFQELAKLKAEEKLKISLAESEKYLTENKKKLGVYSTESGLQYEILKSGTGNKPTLDDTVVVHYTGKLTNGQVFDSSKERGEPATLKLSQVIPGWAEGLSLMSVGSQYRLTIPAEIAFKNQEIGSIPPGSVLLFDVELLDIIKADGKSKQERTEIKKDNKESKS